MFGNVLVGVDGRSGGRDAVALARQLADTGAKLTLVHVDTAEPRPSHAITPGRVQEDRTASAELLERERDAAGADVAVLDIPAGTAGAGLHEAAEASEADLLVVGSCSRGAFGRAMLGDDTRAALNGAPCAIAIAAAGYAVKAAPFATIGVGYNGSPESMFALKAAQRLAASSGAEARVREVITLPTYGYTGIVPPPIGESIDLTLKAANDRLEKLPDVHGKAVCGFTGEELATFGDELDLLVVGSRGYGPMKRMVSGSTSNYLERHARCSLLVLPRSAGARELQEQSQGAAAGVV